MNDPKYTLWAQVGYAGETFYVHGVRAYPIPKDGDENAVPYVYTLCRDLPAPWGKDGKPTASDSFETVLESEITTPDAVKVARVAAIKAQAEALGLKVSEA